MNRLFLLGALLILSASVASADDLPKLVVNEYGVKELIVDGKPYVMLAGEVMNSSSSTLENMAPKWQNLKDLNLNTVLLPVAWKQVEPEEGRYDFGIVDGLIAEARKHDLKVVFLWFGSWKNGSSGYAPYWVMKDTRRFPRMKNKNGENRPFLANYSKNLVEVEARTFAKLMEHIGQVDGQQHTVLMMQVENEPGLLGDSRDRSAHAEKLFTDKVPEAFVDYLVENENRLLPEIAWQWVKHGRKTSGTWEELFGNESYQLADEMFMAWHYASHIQQVAAAGKKAYPLPMYVNAWTIDHRNPVPGVYPSGGPNARMLDVYQAAASAIDILGVDNYCDDYVSKLKEYDRNGNPVFVPEAVSLRGEIRGAAGKAFYTVSECDGLCFSPFAIDSYEEYNENHPLKTAYGVLENLMPLIVKERGSGRMRGFLQYENRNDRIDFGDYELVIRYQDDKRYEGYGLVIRLSENEFLVSGYNANISFRSKDKNRSGVSYGTIREGYFKDGDWHTTRFLGGDEALQGVDGIKLPPVVYPWQKHPHFISTIIVEVIPVEL